MVNSSVIIINCDFEHSEIKNVYRLGKVIPQIFNTDITPCVEANQYLRRLALRNKPKSLKTNAEHLKELLTWLSASLDNLSEITDDSFDFYIDALCEYKKANGEPLSWNTIQSRVSGAYRFLLWAYEKDYCPHLDPTEINDIKLSVSKRYQTKGHHSNAITEPVKFLILDDALRFVKAVGELSGTRNELVKRRNVLLTSFMLQTGVRISEACHFPIKDLPETNSRGHSTPARIVGKGGKARVILIPNELLYQLWEYADIDREKQLDLSPYVDPDECHSLFITKNGQPLSDNWVQKLFRKTSKYIGVKAHPHLLRHTFGTYHYLLNHDLTGLSKLMGHSNEETTCKYYVHTATLVAYTGTYSTMQKLIDKTAENSLNE